VRWGLRRFFFAVHLYRALGPGCVMLARPRCRGIVAPAGAAGHAGREALAFYIPLRLCLTSNNLTSAPAAGSNDPDRRIIRVSFVNMLSGADGRAGLGCADVARACARGGARKGE
jgi:hypothetical protein